MQYQIKLSPLQPKHMKVSKPFLSKGYLTLVDPIEEVADVTNPTVIESYQGNDKLARMRKKGMFSIKHEQTHPNIINISQLSLTTHNSSTIIGKIVNLTSSKKFIDKRSKLL
jgi:hypothetical protein